MNASGTFGSIAIPQPFHVDGINGAQLNTMTVDKVFSGDLVGKSADEMLCAMTTTQGSAGYIALEQVTATLSDNKEESFVLQHSGTMNKVADQLILDVIPDSGARALIGITVSMTIDIKH